MNILIVPTAIFSFTFLLKMYFHFLIKNVLIVSRFVLKRLLNVRNVMNEMKDIQRARTTLTTWWMPMLFQPCIMGRKEMTVGMTQQPPIISVTRRGVILL